MKELSVNHVAFGSAILLHFLLLAFGAGIKAREPEPREQIAIRFTSVSERAEEPAPSEEPRREQAKPNEAVAQPQKAAAVPPPVRETRQPAAPAPAPVLASLQVPAASQQAPPAPPVTTVQSVATVQPVVQTAARSAAQAVPPPPAAPMPRTPQKVGRGQGAVRAVAPAARLPDYLVVVRTMVENNREYPAMARQLALQGTVTVRVSIRGDGSLAAVTVGDSSGHKALDKAAVSAVRRSAPFRPPAGFGLGEVTVEIPIVYRLT